MDDVITPDVHDGGDAAVAAPPEPEKGHGEHAHGEHHEEGFIRKYFWSTDHKIICMQYLLTGMVMAAIGGFMAYAFRMQLAFPGQEVPLFGYVTSATYNSLVTNHGTIMIFWVAMPVLIAAFGNYLIPLMLGCDDMVFPRLNRLSYQVFLISAIVLLCAFFVEGGAFGGAWTAYPPLSAKAEYSLTPLGSTLWVVAVALEFCGLLDGRYQLHHDNDELSCTGHETLGYSHGCLDDRNREYLCSWRQSGHWLPVPSCLCSTSSSVQASLTRTGVVTPSCGSTCSGSSVTQKCTWFYCQRWALWPRSSRPWQEALRLQNRSLHGDRYGHLEFLRVGAPPVHLGY